MRNVLLVIKHEILSTVGRASFWLTAFAVPLVIFVITFGSQFLAQSMATQDEAPQGGMAELFLGSPSADQKPTGYVDGADVIVQIPDDVPAESLVAYSDVDAARAALEAGEISEYYIVPDDILTSGRLELIQSEYSPLGSLGDSDFRYVLTYNVIGDADVAALLQNPMPSVVTERVTIAGEAEEEPRDALATSVVPTLMLFVFFFVITMSSGFMLRSVTTEKENRVVEVLLLSLRPRELMLGKIIGLGVVALLQMAIWMGGSLLTLGQGMPMLGLGAMTLSSVLPPGFVIWVALYFVLGYLTYAAALGALGALAPNAREGGQFTFFVLLPLMVPLWLNSSFSQAPRGALVTFLSLFPLTSPVSMITRMMAVTVPLWQILLSLALQAATTYGFVLLAARFFRSDTLLSNAPLNAQRLKQEILGHRAG
jgi:ABC-2 type transport system permease protein